MAGYRPNPTIPKFVGIAGIMGGIIVLKGGDIVAGKKMVDEENLHHFVLSDLKFYLSDPTGWFTEQEHHGLDGV